jgi:hypothetical protein
VAVGKWLGSHTPEATLAGIRLGYALALLGTAYALAACGAGPADAVNAKVEQFAHDVAKREPALLCQQVLAPSLVSQLTAAGISCDQAMTTFVDSVQGPAMRIGAVRVSGRSASAAVRTGTGTGSGTGTRTGSGAAASSRAGTSAGGSQGSLGTLQLIETKAGWRLTSLVSPR